MAGVWETLFGSSPPPAHPASRGMTFGANYQGMPASQNIEDRTAPGANVFPSRPHDQLNRNRIGPYGQTYNLDQYSWLQNNLPGGQPPTTSLQDPNLALDPSITANIKDAQARAQAAQMNGWGPVTPSQNMPRIAGPLSQGMWNGS